MPNYVPGEGPLECDIALVGEAPGSTENALRRPFVGTSGKLLSHLLRTAGISRSSCYITNVIKEQPPNNNIKRFIDLEKNSPKLTPSYLEYENSLRLELSECSANIIVAVGAVSLYALCRQKGITKWRGSILPSTLIPGKKVIPIIHPAAALREYLFRHLICFDLRRAASQSTFPELKPPPCSLITSPTFDDSIQFITECNSKPYVAFDIETYPIRTHSAQVECFSLCHDGHTSISIPFYHSGNRSYFSIDQEMIILRALSNLLENPAVHKIMHNSIFDSTFMFERYGIIINPIEDTMIAMALVSTDYRKGLDIVTSLYTDFPYYKDDGKERIDNLTGEDSQFWEYSARDSLCTRIAFDGLMSDVRRANNLETYRVHCDLIHPLMMMQHLGSPVDVEAMRLIKEESARLVHELLSELETMVGRPFNPNSPKQCMQLFYVEKGVTPYLKKGKPTCDDTAMQRLARRGFPEATLIQEVRKLQKLIGTYYNVQLDPDDTLRCSYDPIKKTGRLGSRETIFGTGTNRQNQPKSMRKFMLTRRDRATYNIDLGGAESRVVAYVGPVPALRDAYENGVDVHSQTAALIYNIRIEDVSRAPGSSAIPGSTDSQRDIGKRTNHSGNYDVGYKRFALAAGIEEKVAKRILDTYHQVYPEIRHKYQAQIKNSLNNGRVITNPLGRHRRFMGRLDDETYRQAYSHRAQSTVADIINRCLNYIYQEQKEFEYVYLIDQIHDSIVFEIPLELGWLYHARAINKICEFLESPIQWMSRAFSIPAEVDIRRGTHSNSRELVRLVPAGAHPKDHDEYFACQIRRAWDELGVS